MRRACAVAEGIWRLTVLLVVEVRAAMPAGSSLLVGLCKNHHLPSKID